MSDMHGNPGNGSVSADEGSPSPSGQAGSRDPLGGKRLERKLSGRWVAGVCAGLAEYTGIDANLIRVMFAVFTFFGGVGAVAYVVGWALIPEEGDAASIAEKFINKTGT